MKLYKIILSIGLILSAATVHAAAYPVGVGGTGWTALQLGNVLIGNGSSAISTSSALTFSNGILNATYASSTAITVSGTIYGGTLGLGTTSPSTSLSVQGNGLISGTLTVGNIVATSSIIISGLTSGRVPYVTTGGLLTDSTNLTFNGTTLTANTLNLTNQLGISYGGTNATSFTTSGNGIYYNGTSLATAPLASAITIPYASTTAVSSSYASSTSQFAGTLGVATSSTGALLSIGNGLTNGGYYFNSTGLGIGTTSPQSALTINGGNITVKNGQVHGYVASTTYATDLTVNFNSGNTQNILLEANTNIILNATSSNPKDGGHYLINVCQGGAQTYTLTFVTQNLNFIGISPATTTVPTGNKCAVLGLTYYEATQSYDVASTTKTKR